MSAQATVEGEGRREQDGWVDPRAGARRVEELLANARVPRTVAERQAVLQELVGLHASLSESDDQICQKAEMAFLLILDDVPSILADDTFRHFIAQYIDDHDFYGIEWQSVEEVITVAEVLYGFRFRNELPADRVTSYVTELMRSALRQFEREGRDEEMFDLLQRAPLPVLMLDAELTRLRNRLHLYERRRVRQKQRWLYGFLVFQAVFVLWVFPFLFIQAENGGLQRGVEQVTGADLPAEPRQFLDYWDGLYWSIVTSSSVGYGDIAPQTRGGKILAGVAGTMGVLTTGVIAGLILNWMTPRNLS